MGFEKVAAAGTTHRLPAGAALDMLRRMRIPGPEEDAVSGFPHDPQWTALRLSRIALWRERRHTERLLKDHFLAIKAEIGLVEKRVLAKLEDIDTSVSLIAGELARQNSDYGSPHQARACASASGRGDHPPVSRGQRSPRSIPI
jgi:hypothetical protein